ncbi:MAG: hypothetical protein GY853_06400 [PVC group bacterium]|nr:hypothetical protein [PVC group bacterium]
MVTIIIAVLVGISIPHYLDKRFQAHEQKARFNLSQMHKAQKQCWFEEDFTGDGDPDNRYADVGEDAILETYVGFSLDDGHWTYAINSGDASTFDMQATHYDGSHNMNIDQDGTLTTDY